MPDWSASMQQTYEYYIVDPGTWKDKQLLTNVKSCSIQRDTQVDTLGSATIDIVESVGECYIRVYLITIQNGVKEKFPLGTYLVQTPSSSFDGKIRSVTMDAYTPLLELKETRPPIGYFVPKNKNIMNIAYQLTNENTRAPVIPAIQENTLYDNFVANTNDTWITFIRDLVANANHSFDMDEMGRILFTPKQDAASLQPVWTFDDSNSSILYPSFTMDHDLYGIPNVVEVVYTKGGEHHHARVVNNDVNSPASIQNRGREILHRITDPDLGGSIPSLTRVTEYAEQVLRELSTIEYTVSYTHAYCPVRPNDCIRLNYEKAGLVNIKAKVISQSIKCEPGCPVQEKAVFTNKLWG